MENKYTISGFKCFSYDEFNLKRITILAGSNGSGKSSFIQALLLVRLIVEKPLTRKNKVIQKGLIPLNNGYELKLGTVNDIINEANKSKILITLDNDNFEFSMSNPNKRDSELHLSYSYSYGSNDNHLTSFWNKKEFYYLHTERLGPRFGLESNFMDFQHCGHRGEFTAQVILKNEFEKVNDSRNILNSKSVYFKQQLNAWLTYICPGAEGVASKPLSSLLNQIYLKSSAAKSDILATNIGFGISYALPIIVNGLIAKPGTAFIVENPEAHLHPKGQSNIGYFLGKVAAAGIQLIIETHSEHVINGIRRASLSTEGLQQTDVVIYFFNSSTEQRITEISIDESGDLSEFPLDFFDQVSQDMAEIYQLKQDY